MRLSPPTLSTFFAATLAIGVAIAGKLTPIAYVSDNAFWISVGAFAILAIGTLIRGS